MARRPVTGPWFWAAVAIAVIGTVALGASSSRSCPAALDGAADTCASGGSDAGQWIIVVVTVVGTAYCLFRASRRTPRPPSER